MSRVATKDETFWIVGAVECPTCESKVDYYCTTIADGVPTEYYVHDARAWLYRGYLRGITESNQRAYDEQKRIEKKLRAMQKTIEGILDPFAEANL